MFNKLSTKYRRTVVPETQMQEDTELNDGQLIPPDSPDSPSQSLLTDCYNPGSETMAMLGEMGDVNNSSQVNVLGVDTMKDLFGNDSDNIFDKNFPTSPSASARLPSPVSPSLFRRPPSPNYFVPCAQQPDETFDSDFTILGREDRKLKVLAKIHKQKNGGKAKHLGKGKTTMAKKKKAKVEKKDIGTNTSRELGKDIGTNTSRESSPPPEAFDYKAAYYMSKLETAVKKTKLVDMQITTEKLRQNALSLQVQKLKGGADVGSKF